MKILYVLILLIMSNIIVAQDNLVAKIQKVAPKQIGWCQRPILDPKPTYYLYEDGTFQVWDMMTAMIGEGEYSRINKDTFLFEFSQCNYFESKIYMTEETSIKEGLKITTVPFGEPAYGAKLIITRNSLEIKDTMNIGFDEYFSLRNLNLNEPFSIKVIYDTNSFETVNVDLPKWESNYQLNIQLGYKKEIISSKIIAGEKLFFIVNEKEKLGYSFYNSKTKEFHILKCNKNFKLLRKTGIQ